MWIKAHRLKFYKNSRNIQKNILQCRIREVFLSMIGNSGLKKKKRLVYIIIKYSI